MRILSELSWLWETLGIALAAAAVCIACAALICKAAKKKLRKGVGRHRSSGICGCDSGGHSDRPDADAALTGQNVQSDEINSVWRRYDDRERKDAEADAL